MRSKETFQTRVWLYPGTSAAWHFVSLPKELSVRIRGQEQGRSRRGFGAVKVIAQIGKTSWETSIFPDSKTGTYLLPLKAAVRKAEGVFAKDLVTVTLVRK